MDVGASAAVVTTLTKHLESVIARAQCERSQGETKGRQRNFKKSAIPTVAEAVKHLQNQTSRNVVDAERDRFSTEICHPLACDQDAIVVRNGVADFVCPEVCVECGHGLNCAILRMEPSKSGKECGNEKGAK